MAEPKLTLTDELFVSAMAASVLTNSIDADWLALTLKIATDALPDVNRSHSQLAPLCDAASEMLVAAAAAKSVAVRREHYRRGHWEARAALTVFFRWRLGEARARIEAKREKAA